MSASRVVLPLVHVASPCAADWDRMRGDHTQRFCDQCHKVVHNLSAGTAADAARILAMENPCVRFHARRDGSVFTRPSKPAGGLSRAAIAGAVLIASACAPTSPAPSRAEVRASAEHARAAATAATPASAPAQSTRPAALSLQLPPGAEAPPTAACPAPTVAAPSVTPRRARKITGKPAIKRMTASTGSSARPSPDDDPLAGL